MVLRTVLIEDARLIFDWANDAEVRANAINSHKIEWEDHVRWFNNRIGSNNTYIFIAILDNFPVGQIRFDQEEHDYKIDYSIAKEYRGKGLGQELVAKGIDALISIVSKNVKVKAVVKKGNNASEKIFRKLGFSNEPVTLISNIEYFTFSKEIV